jgi:hypothetical protein
MKQKVIRGESTEHIEEQLEEAMSYGWYIQSVVYGDGVWLAILMKDEI